MTGITNVHSVHRVRTQLKPPLRKGRWAAVKVARRGRDKTAIDNPSVKNRFQRTDFCQLPLHRGAFGCGNHHKANDHLPALQQQSSKKQQRQAPEAAQEPAFQRIAHHQAQAEAEAAAPLHLFFPAHKNTPADSLCFIECKKEPSEKTEGSSDSCNEPGEPNGVTTTSAP